MEAISPFDKLLWERAISVPSMDFNALLQFMYKDNFVGEVDKLGRVSFYDSAHYTLYNPAGENCKVDISDLNSVLPIYNMCMANIYFRGMVSKVANHIDCLCNSVTGNYDLLRVDLGLLGAAPLGDFSEFTSYMKYTGLDDAICLIATAYNHRDVRYVDYTNKMLGYSSVYDTKEVLNRERLKPLYDCYISIVLKMNNSGEVIEDVADMFDISGSEKYYLAWVCVTTEFGVPANFYPVKHLPKGYWFSGRSSEDFGKFMSGDLEDTRDFIYGGDYSIGFSEDLYIISHAIDSYRDGEDYMAVSVVEDSRTKKSKWYRVHLSELLSEDRLGEIRPYVEKGFKAYEQFESIGLSSIDGIRIENLDVYKFSDKGSKFYKVYQFIVNERYSGRTKLSDMLKVAEG